MSATRLLLASLAAVSLTACSESEADGKSRSEIIEEVKGELKEAAGELKEGARTAAGEIKAGAEYVAEEAKELVAKLRSELADKKEKLKAAKDRLAQMTLAELATAAGDKIQETVKALTDEIAELTAKVEAKIRGITDND